MYIVDAVEIYTDDGLGVPTSYINTAIGLQADGVISLITGRNTVTTATGATTRTNWTKDILAKGDGDFLPSVAGDFVEAGGFAKFSAISFSLLNTGGGLVQDLADNGVYLGRRRVIVYRGTSTDGVTWAFVRRFTGVIEEQPFDTKTIQIQCVSTAFEIFRSLPSVALPTDPEDENEADAREKLLPIIMGRVAHSQLVGTRKAGDKVALTLIDDVEYFTAASHQYTEVIDSDGDDSYLLRLFTKGIPFIDNDPRLVGKYLSVVAGGTPQIVGIEESSASVMYTDGYGTLVRLRAPLDVSGGAYQAWGDSLDYTNIWYFQVSELAPPLVVAGRPISEYITNAAGVPAVSIYSSEKKAYIDVSEIAPISSDENISGTGFPGFVAVARAGDSNGDLVTYPPIYPLGVKVVAVTGWATDDLPAVGEDAPRLYDRLEADAANYYTLTAGSLVSNPVASLTFDVLFPRDEGFKEYSDIYALVDLEHAKSGGGTMLATIHASGVDVYGRVTQDLDVGRDVYNSTLGVTAVPLHFLPRHYFNTSGSDKKFYSGKAVFSISALIGNSKNSTAYNKIRVRLAFSCAVDGVYSLILKEIGIVAKMAITVTSDPLYVGMIGEKFETTWDGRMVAADPILTVTDMLEGLIRKHDTPGAVWRRGVYKAGEKVRGTADTGHIFVCTAAGTTGATEPTWTDTTGATYTDGGVTWKEYREIPIDTASFNSMASRRGLWFGGLNIRDRKPSEDYYKILLAQTFTLGSINASGNVVVSNWLDDSTPVVTFSAANIVPGSLGRMTPSPSSRAYNEILIQYDENPGNKSYNRRIFITKTDQPEFPAETELLSNGTDLGAFSILAGPVGGGMFALIVTTTLAHGMVTGDYAMLEGNLDGYDFTAAPISVSTPYVFSLLLSGFFLGTSTTGTLYHVLDRTPLWKSYAVGIRNYGTGRDLWEALHEGYLIDMVVNRLPEELGNCPFFIDPYAKDAAGALLWPDLDVGDDHPAVWYAQYLAGWCPLKKPQNSLEVYQDAAFESLGYGSCVALNHAITGGVDKIGWIHEKTALAATGINNPERWRFGVTFMPDQYVEYNIIDENGATDIIDENSATDIIDEN